MEIKPIKTAVDYHEALGEIGRLFTAAPDTPGGDRLEVLVTLVQAYEDKHHRLPPPDPVEAIEYYMESRGLSRRAMEPYLGNRGRVSEILNRRRPLTLAMIRRLEEGLGIPTSILIRPYETGPSGRTTFWRYGDAAGVHSLSASLVRALEPLSGMIYDLHAVLVGTERAEPSWPEEGVNIRPQTDTSPEVTVTMVPDSRAAAMWVDDMASATTGSA